MNFLVERFCLNIVFYSFSFVYKALNIFVAFKFAGLDPLSFVEFLSP